MDAFDRYKAFQLYCLKPRAVDDDEYKHLRNELDWVMSGKHNDDLIKELVDEGRRKGVQKRKRTARSALCTKKERARQQEYNKYKRQNKSAK